MKKKIASILAVSLFVLPFHECVAGGNGCFSKKSRKDRNRDFKSEERTKRQHAKELNNTTLKTIKKRLREIDRSIRLCEKLQMGGLLSLKQAGLVLSNLFGARAFLASLLPGMGSYAVYKCTDTSFPDPIGVNKGHCDVLRWIICDEPTEELLALIKRKNIKIGCFNEMQTIHSGHCSNYDKCGYEFGEHPEAVRWSHSKEVSGHPWDKWNCLLLNSSGCRSKCSDVPDFLSGCLNDTSTNSTDSSGQNLASRILKIIASLTALLPVVAFPALILMTIALLYKCVECLKKKKKKKKKPKRAVKKRKKSFGEVRKKIMRKQSKISEILYGFEMELTDSDSSSSNEEFIKLGRLMKERIKKIKRRQKKINKILDKCKSLYEKALKESEEQRKKRLNGAYLPMSINKKVIINKMTRESGKEQAIIDIIMYKLEDLFEIRGERLDEISRLGSSSYDSDKSTLTETYETETDSGIEVEEISPSDEEYTTEASVSSD